jgi:alpha-L-arabinofuranosidase
MMGRSQRLAVFILLLLTVVCEPLDAASDSNCEARLLVSSGLQNVVKTLPNADVIRTLNPTFFGFNLEWVDFQQDLWDSTKLRVKPEVINWLKPFGGAVYRYPGGTGSNYLNWRDTVGSQDERPLQKHADWLPPFSPSFGFDDYLDFVSKVDGKAWVVLNIYGNYTGEMDRYFLAQNAADWASYANKRTNAGGPQIFRWELGNELDRGNTKWPPDKYVDIAKLISRAVKKSSPEAKFVGMLQDWQVQKEISSYEYNRTIMAGLNDNTQEFSHHLYYEDLAWETVQQRMFLVCKSVETAKNLKIIKPTFWITEHARNLQGQKTFAEFKSTWVKTANLESAIITAEAYISATQFPEIESLFLHSLGTAHGPWPLFNASKDGSLHPSAVYWAVRILRDSMLPNVLFSQVQSRNDEKSLGDHDVRATVLTDNDQSHYAVWAVNRYQRPTQLTMKIPSLKGKKMLAKNTYIGDSNKEANNYAFNDRVKPQVHLESLIFDSDGVAVITLPSYSVLALRMTIQ